MESDEPPDTEIVGDIEAFLHALEQGQHAESYEQRLAAQQQWLVAYAQLAAQLDASES